jgi:hypothetical protein
MSGQSTPKTMSSRLLTMKFMQRAAAGTPSPAPSATATPDNKERSSKRRKTSHSPISTVSSEPVIDQKAIQAAFEEGEKKRQEAIEKRAAELGDERWVLNVEKGTASPIQKDQTPLNVAYVGFAQIDNFHGPSSPPDSGEDYLDVGIRRFNMGKKKRVSLHASSEWIESTGSSLADSR